MVAEIIDLQTRKRKRAIPPKPKYAVIENGRLIAGNVNFADLGVTLAGRMNGIKPGMSMRFEVVALDPSEGRS